MTDPRRPSGGPLVAEVAVLLLRGIVDHFRDAEVVLPKRQYIAAGGPREVAYDCAQLTVALAGIGPGASEDRSQSSQRAGSPMAALTLRHAILAVSLVRPEFEQGVAEAAEVWNPEDDPRFPSAEALHANGLRNLHDASLVSQALINVATGVRDLPTVKELSREHGRTVGVDGLVKPGPVECLGPAGGFVSVEATFSVTVGTQGG